MPASSSRRDAGSWVLSFYRFCALADPAALRDAVEAACIERGLLGTVYVATEGVNAALAGSQAALADMESLLAALCPHTPRDVSPNWAVADGQAFRRLKVRLKDEIVGFVSPLASDAVVGEHVDATAWDELVDDPDVHIVDVRNSYEHHIGTFRDATLANTQTFRDFVRFAERELDPGRDKRIGTFCTGGIRCEKASAWLLAQGFEQVYQLQGGILGYLAATEPAESRFEGECFVFDDRVSVNAELRRGSYRLCERCGWPRPCVAPSASCAACGG